MQRPSLDPAKITRPIQLSAAWFATLLILDGTLLAAAAKISKPGWAAGALVTAAIAMPILVGFVVFLLQTQFREEQMADPFYADLIRRKDEQFRGFAPEAVSAPIAITPDGEILAESEAKDELDERANAYWS